MTDFCSRILEEAFEEPNRDKNFSHVFHGLPAATSTEKSPGDIRVMKTPWYGFPMVVNPRAYTMTYLRETARASREEKNHCR